MAGKTREVIFVMQQEPGVEDPSKLEEKIKEKTGREAVVLKPGASVQVVVLTEGDE